MQRIYYLLRVITNLKNREVNSDFMESRTIVRQVIRSIVLSTKIRGTFHLIRIQKKVMLVKTLRVFDRFRQMLACLNL